MLWIVGDSIVYHLYEHCRDVRRHFPYNIEFKGKGGGGPSEAYSKVLKAYNRSDPAPDAIVFHTGGNRLAVVPTSTIRSEFIHLIKQTKRLYPSAAIIWSDILPRRFWTEARCQNSVMQNLPVLNRQIRRIFQSRNCYTIRHPKFKLIYENFRKFDVTHPSDIGHEILLKDFLAAMAYFASHPNRLIYPFSQSSD